jgi:hypothetical protein
MLANYNHEIKSEENVFCKNHHIHVFGFQCVAKNIKGWFDIYTLLLVYSQIWLNLPRHDCHFGYKQKNA